MQAEHRQRVSMMMQANEALHTQLKDLNGVVERVLQRSLSGAPQSSASTPRLPVGAFPSQAKPGSKGQKPVATGPLPKPAKQQQQPGARPFK